MRGGAPFPPLWAPGTHKEGGPGQASAAQCEALASASSGQGRPSPGATTGRGTLVFRHHSSKPRPEADAKETAHMAAAPKQPNDRKGRSTKSMQQHRPPSPRRQKGPHLGRTHPRWCQDRPHGPCPPPRLSSPCGGFALSPVPPPVSPSYKQASRDPRTPGLLPLTLASQRGTRKVKATLLVSPPPPRSLSLTPSTAQQPLSVALHTAAQTHLAVLALVTPRSWCPSLLPAALAIYADASTPLFSGPGLSPELRAHVATRPPDTSIRTPRGTACKAQSSTAPRSPSVTSPRRRSQEYSRL